MSPVTPSSRRFGGGGDPFFMRFDFAGHANRREGIVKLLQRFDAAGGTNLNSATQVAVPFASVERRDGDFWDPPGSNPATVRFLKAGVYRVKYSVVADVLGVGSAKVYARKNGGASDLVGSVARMSLASTTAPGSAAHATFVADFAAGDWLEVYAVRDGTDVGNMSTVAGASSILVELLSYTGETALGSRQVADRNAFIEKCTLSKDVGGYSGVTYVDVLRNGVSLCGSNKLSITPSQTFVEYPSSSFQIPFIPVGSEVTVDVIGEEVPYPRGVCVVLKLAPPR